MQGVWDLLSKYEFKSAGVKFEQLSYSESAVWSLLLAGGYLKIAGSSGRDSEDYENGIEDISYKLALTNQEIVFLFKRLIRGWFHTGDAAYNDFIKALLANDAKAMNVYMSKIVSTMLSYFDSGNKPSEKTEPERFYHGLVLGMITDLSKKYIVTSNRESGLGRYDVMLEPRSPEDDGIIFEFKVFDGQEEFGLNDTVNAAVRQILDKNMQPCWKKNWLIRIISGFTASHLEEKKCGLTAGILKI